LYASIIDKLPEIRAVVAWGIEKIPEEFAKDSRIFLWKDFMLLGNDVNTAEVDLKMDK